MRNFMFAVLVSLGLLSCATGQTASEKKAVARQLQSQVEDSVQGRTFNIIIDYANPLRMPPRHLTTSYSIALRGDTVSSWLPYFGVAQRADMANDDKSPLSFRAPIYGLSVERGKKDAYDIRFNTRNNSELLEYRLTIFPNGSTVVYVTSNYRDPIDFDGHMDVKLAGGGK